MADRKPRKRAIKHKVRSSRKSYWLYGLHSVLAALHNPARRGERLVATQAAVSAVGEIPGTSPTLQIIKPEALTGLLPVGAVHQGLALLVSPLTVPNLESVLPDVVDKDDRSVLILDQVTDPRNVGAILRSAAAFNTKAVIVPDRHAPSESGVMVKAASGAFELVPMIRVPNLSQALRQIATRGYWCIGLDQNGERSLTDAIVESPMALIIGGEGKGLRRLTRERCDDLARIPIASTVPSLNVSTSAAIALYEINCRLKISYNNHY